MRRYSEDETQRIVELRDDERMLKLAFEQAEAEFLRNEQSNQGADSVVLARYRYENAHKALTFYQQQLQSGNILHEGVHIEVKDLSVGFTGNLIYERPESFDGILMNILDQELLKCIKERFRDSRLVTIARMPNPTFSRSSIGNHAGIVKVYLYTKNDWKVFPKELSVKYVQHEKSFLIDVESRLMDLFTDFKLPLAEPRTKVLYDQIKNLLPI